jgi:hypothetical protein
MQAATNFKSTSALKRPTTDNTRQRTKPENNNLKSNNHSAQKARKHPVSP